MSEKEVVVTREMVKAIVKDAITKIALWSILAVAATVLSGAVWVGVISSDVEDLKDYKEKTAPTINENAATLREIAIDLKYIRKQVEVNGYSFQKIANDFDLYKDAQSKEIQEFYRKNPNL